MSFLDPLLVRLPYATTSDTRFWYAHFAAGLLFGNKYLLAAGKPIGGPSSLMNLEWQVGITVLRSGNN